MLLNKYNAFVQLCFSYSGEAEIHKAVSESDIVISACGVPGLIRSSWLKEASIVIDVGISYVPLHTDLSKTIITGDVEFNEDAL